MNTHALTGDGVPLEYRGNGGPLPGERKERPGESKPPIGKELERKALSQRHNAVQGEKAF